jgi:hypothetical protein
MVYKFKSRADADLIMLKEHGDVMLQIIGREPSARGIIEVQAMPAALAALQGALDESPVASDNADPDATAPPVGLHQRLWPMIEMLKRCQAAGEPVVWGV